ncbi:MAG: hypothetical protein PF517_01395 [Salinivirgaceae bacterium]|nr:hypothetical protein [Salinivirgaceae bacterium]
MKELHFTDEQVAMCAEALSQGDVSGLSESLKKHLSECDECAQQVAFVSELSEQIDAIEMPTQKTRKLSLFYRIGAAAAILILIGLGIYSKSVQPNGNDAIAEIIIDSINTQIENEQNINLVQKDRVVFEIKKENSQETKATNKESELLAYATHAEMEKLVDRFRTGAMRGNDVKVVSAIEIEGVSTEITLEWQNLANKELIVEFFNNKGEKLFEETTTASSYKPEQITIQGLYYWKLINKDFDLIFCGKIKIK